MHKKGSVSLVATIENIKKKEAGKKRNFKTNKAFVSSETISSTLCV